jgi:ribosomal protein S18 acetylase RimI-like enzyme
VLGEEGKKVEGKKEEEELFGIEGKHGSQRLRDDAFVKGDEHQARMSEGRDYVKLSTLTVFPQYQRRGIGAILFEEGLKVADEAGLQTILGASDQGIGLYKKYGCVECVVLDLKLWEYEGGEGLGVTRHVFLHRPALSK